MLRLFGNLFFGVCLSACGAGLLTFIGILTNLPRIIQGLLLLWRLILRISFQAYALILSRLQPFALGVGLDVLSLPLRTLTCALLSLGIGCGILTLLNVRIGNWWLVIFGLHGLVIGLAWEGIVQPGEFQLGERMQ